MRRAEGGVRYACVGKVFLGVLRRRRGVDGPAIGSDAMLSRGGSGDDERSSSDIFLTSSSDDEVEAALRTGNSRIFAEVEEVLVDVLHGRFDGVSGGASSSSEAVTSEKEKETLRFRLLVRDGVRLALRRADFVGDADRDCEGVDVGVFDVVLLSAFFLRISLIARPMVSLRSTHSSSIIPIRLVKILSDTPNLSTRLI
jgi:hypothetical protein